MNPLVSLGDLLYLDEGNVNAAYTDATTTEGYLDGPDVAIFDWNDNQTNDCAAGVQRCATISTSENHRNDNGPTRPHWGISNDGQYAGTLYHLFRDVSRNYFDAYNNLPTRIRDVDNSHELVVMFNRPWETAESDSGPCGGSCMRPHTGTRASWRIFRGSRPDGRNGGAPYYDRPKLFLKTMRPNGNYYSSSSINIQVPVHEFGHYYNRVVAREYGTGGFIWVGESGGAPYEEQALDEGLGYWYVSDYASQRMVGRESETGTEPKYSTYDDPDGASADPCTPGAARCAYDEHHLGNVITYALWSVRQDTSCDTEKWRRAIFVLVDNIPAGSFANQDPFGGSSIMRGFSYALLREADLSGACNQEALREAAAIFIDRELVPGSFFSQAVTHATNEPKDRFGHSMATGDFNGDGIDDLAITSPHENEGANDTGMVHVIYGDTLGIDGSGTSRFSRLNQAVLNSALERGDKFGWSVAAGDFNGDGIDDLAVGSPYEKHKGVSNAGMVHIFRGSSNGLRLTDGGEKIDQSSGGSTVESGDLFGYALSSGDFNGDGIYDLAVASPGEDLSGGNQSGYIQIFFGSLAGLLPADVEAFRQEDLGSTSEPNDKFGFSLTSGDFDDDGFDDLVIGSPYENVTNQQDSGFVWVVPGNVSGLAYGNVTRIDQSSAGSRNERGDLFGYSLTVGDFNGDGRDDLAIGAPHENISGRSNTGYIFRFYGSSSGIRTSQYSRWSQTTGGSSNESGDQFGRALSSGDFDGDGFDDLAVGIPYEDTSDGAESGFVHLYYGATSRGLPSRNARLDAGSFGMAPAAGDRFGWAMAAGDFNGDGIMELAISARGRDMNEVNSSGGVFVRKD